MNLKTYDFLEKHPKINYLQKCIRRIGNPKWVNSVLDIDNNPLLFQMENRGEEYKGKIICHIKIENRTRSGFFALLNSVLNGMYGIDRLGFIPYVEYDGNTCYSEDEPVNGTMNAYEYYFVQYGGLERDKVNSACCVAAYEPRNARVWPGIKSGYAQNPERICELSRIYGKYIHLNDATAEYINSGISDKIKGKTLGIHVRATDFITSRDVNHPVGVGYEHHMTAAEKILNTGDFDRIFLATDDADVVDEFKKKFGDMVVYYDDINRSTDGKCIHHGAGNRAMNKYLNGLEVLRDVYTLANCSGLIAGLSMVSFFARIINKSLEKDYGIVEIIDKGINQSGKRAR